MLELVLYVVMEMGFSGKYGRGYRWQGEKTSIGETTIEYGNNVFYQVIYLFSVE